MDNMNESLFTSHHGFCPDCGSILPLLGEVGGVQCWSCKRMWGPDVFGDMRMSHTIICNSLDVYTKAQQIEQSKKNDSSGPVLERKCPKCDNDKMTYATLQLRSADEGQTVFYTCVRCKFKETENS